jgi:methylated-DNA-protein-cysteine methyltransferase related protein
MTDSFAQVVYEHVAQIPPGRVMTYGQLAALAGSPRAARIVGGIAHFGPEELPWHRVVNKQGRLAATFPGGRTEHARRLEAEGIRVDEDHHIAIDTLLWWPPESNDLSSNNYNNESK